MTKKFTHDPYNGSANPAPSDVDQYRSFYPNRWWFYNPWTGMHRETHEVSDDPYGKRLEEAIKKAVA